MEFEAEHLAHRGGGFFVADLGEDFLEEALREQFLGDGERDAAGAQVEEFGGADRPAMPFSSTKPRMGPTWPPSDTSLAQTTNTSAMGLLEIHILLPDSL